MFYAKFTGTLPKAAKFGSGNSSVTESKSITATYTLEIPAVCNIVYVTSLLCGLIT